MIKLYWWGYGFLSGNTHANLHSHTLYNHKQHSGLILTDRTISLTSFIWQWSVVKYTAHCLVLLYSAALTRNTITPFENDPFKPFISISLASIWTGIARMSCVMHTCYSYVSSWVHNRTYSFRCFIWFVHTYDVEGLSIQALSQRSEYIQKYSSQAKSEWIFRDNLSGCILLIQIFHQGWQQVCQVWRSNLWLHLS